LEGRIAILLTFLKLKKYQRKTQKKTNLCFHTASIPALYLVYTWSIFKKVTIATEFVYLKFILNGCTFQQPVANNQSIVASRKKKTSLYKKYLH